EACKEDGDDVLSSSMEVKRLAYEIAQVLLRDYAMIKIDGALCSSKEDKAIGKRLRFGSKE
ncbi:hypothetical protein Tco_0883509, partial [Tanacetum coccineum]